MFGMILFGPLPPKCVATVGPLAHWSFYSVPYPKKNMFTPVGITKHCSYSIFFLAILSWDICHGQTPWARLQKRNGDGHKVGLVFSSGWTDPRDEKKRFQNKTQHRELISFWFVLLSVLFTADQSFDQILENKRNGWMCSQIWTAVVCTCCGSSICPAIKKNTPPNLGL